MYILKKIFMVQKHFYWCYKLIDGDIILETPLTTLKPCTSSSLAFCIYFKTQGSSVKKI